MTVRLKKHAVLSDVMYEASG